MVYRPTEEIPGLHLINLFSASWREISGNREREYECEGLIILLLTYTEYSFWSLWNYLYEYNLLISTQESIILVSSYSF